MYYLIYGDDKIKARMVAQKTVAAGKIKHNEAGFFKLTSENFTADKLDEQIGSQGLFYDKALIFLDNLCEEEESGVVLVKRLKDIKESPNFFVILEGKLNKAELEKFKKYAEKTEEFKKVEKKLNKKELLAQKGEKIDFFEFANALGEKDKKKLWTLYQDALAESVPAEEVHGIFFWQVKAMLAAIKSKDAVEAGLNPYVYSKSKSYAKGYGEDKLKQMSQALFEMYHEAHRGKTDFHIALERFILEI